MIDRMLEKKILKTDFEIERCKMNLTLIIYYTSNGYEKNPKLFSS